MTEEAVSPDDFPDGSPDETPDACLDRTAIQLSRALADETALARAGALPALAAAGLAKREAFDAFLQARAALPVPPVSVRTALQALIAAADENALVLEAVGATLEHTANRLRRILSARADPGIYSPTGPGSRHLKGPGPRHLLAAQLDAKI